jgi:hypothetical protein
MHPIFFSFKKKIRGFFRRTKRQVHRHPRKPTIVIPGTDLDMGDKFARIPVSVEKK